jgi:hypothetical protein
VQYRALQRQPIDGSPGIAEAPETGVHPSVKERVDHVEVQGRIEHLKADSKRSVAGPKASAGLEQSHWVRPIEDRRRLDSTREGMPEEFPPAVRRYADRAGTRPEGPDFHADSPIFAGDCASTTD